MSHSISCQSSLARQRGLSLVELMVGIAVGLVVITAIIVLFTNNSRARQEMEKTAQQIENGRYATQLLLEDFRLGGYYGELNPVSLATPATKPDPCLTDKNSLQAALPLPVQGYDNGGTVPSCLSDVKSGTDIVVIRRTSTCVAGTSNCDPIDTNQYTYFQTALCASTMGQFVIDTNASAFTLTKKGCNTAAALRSYYTRIYFVANNNQSGDGIPTLKMAELGSGAFTIVPLVAGIEQLHFEYGIDTNGDGTPEIYTANPDAYNGCSGVACQTNWRQVTAIKIQILTRNTQASPGFTDTRTYVLGKLADGVTDNTFGPYNNGYKRHVYSTVVRLNNVAGRLE